MLYVTFPALHEIKEKLIVNAKFDQILSQSLAFILFLGLSYSAWSACTSEIPLYTPTPDFLDHNDGTVTHTPTGLMWKVCSEGQSWSPGSCTGSIGEHSWAAALQIPSTLNGSGGFANYSDWRLPNLKELASITEKACSAPAFNITVFPLFSFTVPFWSSSPYLGTGDRESTDAWAVSFGNGNNGAASRNLPRAVRLVRGGQ